ncbi:MAG: sterol transfer family protein [Actinomycetia bacterium]|nr:sterol transfer family protein [Actinomycetes bacterium]
MAKHVFLSDDWLTTVEALVADRAPADGETPDLMMDVTVTDTPFGEDRTFHVGSKDGAPLWGHGPAEHADVTVTTAYDIAKDLFLTGDAQAPMQAFFTGKLILQGDVTKLIAASAGGAAMLGGAADLAAELRDITE